MYSSELRGIPGYLAGARALSVVAGGSPFLKIATAALGVEARHAAAYAIALTQLGMATETAPLPSENNGWDVALDPDVILSVGGAVPGGAVPAVSGAIG